MPQLSILIPARNEIFLGKTIENILENIEGDTEIIAVLDGYDKPIPQIPEDERVSIIKYHKPVGQRAATNQAAKLSRAKYVMKVDAHCSFDKGFDRIMMEDMQDDITMVPVMRNLHAFDWVCKNGHRRYQGPSGPCTKCGDPTEMDIKWFGKPNPQCTSYRFDRTLRFQYWREYKDQQKGDLVETLSLQGSCFMMTREKYWELDICDEAFGSWGQQGVEVACKTWLSGGRVVVNKNTWYAHLFRTQGGDFSFPYKQNQRQIRRAREMSRDIFINDKWPKAVHTFKWLLEKFNPPEWDDNLKPDKKELTKGIVYYTDSKLKPEIMKACQDQIKKGSNGHEIVSVSLRKKLDFGKNVVMNLQRGYLTMFKQILAGLKASNADIIFFCEHDVYYHPSHFDFTPPEKDKFYYNENIWQTDGKRCLHFDCQKVSGLCAYRELLIEHYEKRVKIIEESGWNRRIGFEPGTHNRAERIDDYKSGSWWSEAPNIDIRHSGNLTKTRWRKDQFRNQRFTKGWAESDEIPGWGSPKNLNLGI